jgi:hypothetical protein
MDELTRRRIEMGRRVLEFCRAHPDSNPEWNDAVSRLEATVARADELMEQERQERTAQVYPLTERRRKPRGTEKPADSEPKVIPFRKPTEDDPTDPAA